MAGAVAVEQQPGATIDTYTYIYTHEKLTLEGTADNKRRRLPHLGSSGPTTGVGRCSLRGVKLVAENDQWAHESRLRSFRRCA